MPCFYAAYTLVNMEQTLAFLSYCAHYVCMHYDAMISSEAYSECLPSIVLFQAEPSMPTPTDSTG